MNELYWVNMKSRFPEGSDFYDRCEKAMQLAAQGHAAGVPLTESLQGVNLTISPPSVLLLVALQAGVKVTQDGEHLNFKKIEILTSTGQAELRAAVEKLPNWAEELPFEVLNGGLDVLLLEIKKADERAQREEGTIKFEEEGRMRCVRVGENLQIRRNDGGNHWYEIRAFRDDWRYENEILARWLQGRN